MSGSPSLMLCRTNQKNLARNPQTIPLRKIYFFFRAGLHASRRLDAVINPLVDRSALGKGTVDRLSRSSVIKRNHCENVPTVLGVRSTPRGAGAGGRGRRRRHARYEKCIYLFTSSLAADERPF